MNENNLKDYLDFAKRAVIEAAKFIETKKISGYKIIRKDIKELVTEIDMAAQSQLINSIKKETGCHSIMTEEIRDLKLVDSECWIIDPMDGTHNFIAGLPFYCIAVGYMYGGEMMLGAIYFPESKNLYYAQKGKGAFRDTNRIYVSSNTDITKSIVAYDNQFYLVKNSISNFIKIQEKVFTTRILGVASRDACYVAEGILDARIWNFTKLCDVAVGGLIVQEAGGKVTDFSGNKLNFQSIKNVVVSSRKFHDELISILKDEEAYG